MNVKFTIDWLKKRADMDEGAEFSAGALTIDELAQEANALRQSPGEQLVLGEAFGKLIRLMRDDRHLSLDDLASSAEVDAEELVKIESVASYVPEPRTVFQLAKVLKLPEKKMLQLSGNMIVRDSELTSQAERFAANAKHIDHLSKDQRDVLMVFVRYLADSR
mgnify:CR=1 FL=1